MLCWCCDRVDCEVQWFCFSLSFLFSYLAPNNDCTPGYHAPTTIEVETQFMTSSNPVAKEVTSPASTVTSPASTRNLLSPSPRKSPLLGFRHNHSNKNAKNNNTLTVPTEDHPSEESPKKSVTKFNFHMRHSKKKKDTRRDRRERKATTTLAIVLGKCIPFLEQSAWLASGSGNKKKSSGRANFMVDWGRVLKSLCHWPWMHWHSCMGLGQRHEFHFLHVFYSPSPPTWAGMFQEPHICRKKF